MGFPTFSKIIGASWVENNRIWRALIRYLCAQHFCCATVSHLITHFSDPTLSPRRGQNEHSVTASPDKVDYSFTYLHIQHFDEICGEPGSEFWIDYVTTHKHCPKHLFMVLYSRRVSSSILPPSGALFCPDPWRTRTHNSIQVKHAWRPSIILTAVIGSK